jgi:CheY-like chemotaxis protein
VVVLNAINKSDKLKEIFLATMSHELRTPINGISGAISLLKDTKLTDEQHQLLDACRVSELSIATSIDDILEFTGMMSKNIKIAQAPLSVYSIIHHTVDLFKNEYETKGLTIQVEAPTTTEEYFLGDKNRLGHALRHLIGNAVKFSNQGLIYISVEHELVDAINQQEMISISISDEGPGIPESKLKQVLTPFSQIDGSFSRKHQGMGIGVSICNAIAKAMGGELILKNKSTGGLTAIFRFCAEKSFHSVPDDQHHATPSVEKKASDIKVLVVEDNEVNQLVIKGILDKFGYQSDSAMNGQEAVHKVEDNTYDIILMDCQMPIMDGFEATRQIRLNTADKKHIPIIAVTANAMEGDKERCLDCGMDDYLKKPISLNRLGAAIQTQLRKDHGV